MHAKKPVEKFICSSLTAKRRRRPPPSLLDFCPAEKIYKDNKGQLAENAKVINIEESCQACSQAICSFKSAAEQQHN